MSSSGEYLNKSNQIVMGTSLRVLSVLNKVKGNYPSKKLKLIVNDIGLQEVNCIKCRIDKIAHDNIEVEIKNKDVREFLLEIKNNSDLGNNYHVLLFYDPFSAEIYWDEIGKYLHGSRFDLILTHFHQNDTQRVISKKISKKTRDKYEKTYGLKFEQLKCKLDGKSGREMNIILRDLIVANMKKFLGYNNSYIACLPVFNKNNKDVYDIVLYSKSEGALEKFKNAMYKVMSKRVEEYDKIDQKELSLISEEGNQALIFDMKDLHYFYSVKTFARLIAKEFSGLQISNSQLNDFLKNHSFIPTNIKTEVDRWLNTKFNVEVIKIEKLKYYKFPNIGEGDIF